jgi:hydroxymethylpyrimidine/phosphomethylpyrimidine kinase
LSPIRLQRFRGYAVFPIAFPQAKIDSLSATPPAMSTPPIALTIAGFDTSGGAGLQADLLAFHNHGYHTLTAITTVVTETPLEVVANEPVSPESLSRQLALLQKTYPIAAIKIGLLASPAQVTAITPLLKSATCPIVLDPVIVASTGTTLHEDETAFALINELAPLAFVLTPNLTEAKKLLGAESEGLSPRDIALALNQKITRPVLLTGGDQSDPETVTDLLADVGTIEAFQAERVQTEASLHGTGCVLSSALAAALGKGLSLAAAVPSARQYLREALANHYTIPYSKPLLALNHHAPRRHDP